MEIPQFLKDNPVCGRVKLLKMEKGRQMGLPCFFELDPLPLKSSNGLRFLHNDSRKLCLRPFPA